MEKLSAKARDCVCGWRGGGVGKIYVLVGGIFICFFFNGTERGAFGKERKKTFSEAGFFLSSSEKKEKSSSRKSFFSATHTLPTRHVTFFLPLFKRKYVSLNGFHLHIFACVEEFSSVGEQIFLHVFLFGKAHGPGCEFASLRWGWQSLSKRFLETWRLLSAVHSSGWLGWHFVSEDARKEFLRSTLSGESSFSRKEEEKKKWHRIKSYFLRKLPRKAQLNRFVEIKYFLPALGSASHFLSSKADLFAC